MTIADWLMILAVLVGPIVAVQLTRYLDDKKEIRGIFHFSFDFESGEKAKCR